MSGSETIQALFTLYDMFCIIQHGHADFWRLVWKVKEMTDSGALRRGDSAACVAQMQAILYWQKFHNAFLVRLHISLGFNANKIGQEEKDKNSSVLIFGTNFSWLNKAATLLI